MQIHWKVHICKKLWCYSQCCLLFHVTSWVIYKFSTLVRNPTDAFCVKSIFFLMKWHTETFKVHPSEKPYKWSQCLINLTWNKSHFWKILLFSFCELSRFLCQLTYIFKTGKNHFCCFKFANSVAHQVTVETCKRSSGSVYINVH